MTALLLGLALVAAPPKQENKTTVRYKVLQQWSIPNGGHGRLIVIDPRYRNEADMRRLGDQLRTDTKEDRNAIVHIFDSERAAKLRKDISADKASKKDEEYFDKHFIGMYLRNANNNKHELTIMLKGVGEDSIEVKY